ncbi:hypothetical protein QM312_37215, partial [Burkholderia cenocepacia]|nr:hypothetical protein [Burkholderia cenocepacia]
MRLARARRRNANARGLLPFVVICGGAVMGVAGLRAPGAASPREPHMRLRPARRAGRRDAGLALPAVIAVGAAVAALTGTWFDAALTESRRTRALSDRLIAFHAASAAS